MPISDDPEKNKVAEVAAIEFIKLCDQRGLEPEQMIQAAIVAAAAAIETEAEGDEKYVAELVERCEVSLRSAVGNDADKKEQKLETKPGPCRKCQGSGSVPSGCFSRKVCKRCKGTGVEQDRIYADGKLVTACPICNGLCCHNQ